MLVGSCNFREELLCCGHYATVNLTNCDVLYTAVLDDLPKHASISTANHQ